jgi:outer membrane beta-barrel protein
VSRFDPTTSIEGLSQADPEDASHMNRVPHIVERGSVSAVRALLAVLVACASATTVRAADEPPEPGATGSETDETTEETPEVEPDIEIEQMVRVVQRRPILKKNRFELFTGAGVVLNDDMYDHWLATATGRFHVSEWISVGATYGKFFSSVSDLQNTIANDYEVYPELSAYRWYAGADVSLVAVEGKFVAFGSTIAYWDFYASLGGGVTVTSRSKDPKPTGVIGAGLRLFFGDWLTLSVELRDHILFEKFRAGSELVNNLVAQAGLTLFIPFGFDYEYAK